MNVYKKYIILALVIPLPFVMAFVINLYLYDPVQIFHKPYFRETTFFGDMRVAARGIIQHYPFDSYILGTSMLENTSAREAKEKLGGEWVNISMSGSTFEERAIVMQYLFGIKQPKNILYSLDYLYLTSANKKVEVNNIPLKLYNTSKLDDLSFYLNDRFTLCSFVWSKNEKCVGRDKNIENSLVEWISLKKYSDRFGGIKNWTKYASHPDYVELLKVLRNFQTEPFIIFETQDISEIQNRLQKTILSFVKQNPSTSFSFVIPTYSRLSYWVNIKYLPEKNERFIKFKTFLRWFSKELESYPNAKIYGFDDTDYADEIANYKDLTHYNIDMNSMQLDAIRDNTHRLTSENIEEYLKTMELKIQEYDVEPLVKIAKEALGE